jgi:hypothetical protein
MLGSALVGLRTSIVGGMMPTNASSFPKEQRGASAIVFAVVLFPGPSMAVVPVSVRFLR